MTIKRLDHVSDVVDDLAAAIAFFTALGMTVEGEAPVEGPWVDRVNGLESVQVDIVMMAERPDSEFRRMSELCQVGSFLPNRGSIRRFQTELPSFSAKAYSCAFVGGRRRRPPTDFQRPPALFRSRGNSSRKTP